MCKRLADLGIFTLALVILTSCGTGLNSEESVAPEMPKLDSTLSEPDKAISAAAAAAIPTDTQVPTMTSPLPETAASVSADSSDPSKASFPESVDGLCREITDDDSRITNVNIGISFYCPDDWWVEGGEEEVELPGDVVGYYYLHSSDSTYFAFIVIYGSSSIDLRAALEQGQGLYIVAGGYDAQFADERVGSSNGLETISVTGAGTSPDVSFAAIRAYDKDHITAVAVVMETDKNGEPDLEPGVEILDSITIGLQ
jgi:hypothetical protein